MNYKSFEISWNFTVAIFYFPTVDYIIVNNIIFQVQKYFSELFGQVVPKGHGELKLTTLGLENNIESAVGKFSTCFLKNIFSRL